MAQTSNPAQDGGVAASPGSVEDHQGASTDGEAPADGASQQLRAAALAGVANAVMVTEADGTIVWINPAFTQMSGYGFEEVVGRTPRVLRSGVQGKDHYEHLWSTILSGRPWRGEVVERHKDGHFYTVVQSITPVLGDDGGVSNFVAIHEDVTPLRASQARMRSLFQHAIDAIAFLDAEGRVVEANPAFYSLLDRPPGSLTGVSLGEFSATERQGEFEERWAALLASGRAQGLTEFLRGEQQVLVEFQAVTSIEPDVHLLVARDVTAQRAAESQQRFQAQLLDAVAEAVVAVDGAGIIRYANPAAATLFGWQPDAEVIGQAATDVGLPAGWLRQYDAIRDAVENRALSAGQYELPGPSGQTVSVFVTNAAFRTWEGDADGVISVWTDVTELHRMQRALTRRANQQATVAEFGQWASRQDDPAAVADEARNRAQRQLPPDVELELHWPEPAAARADEAVIVPIQSEGPEFHLVGAIAHLDEHDVEFVSSLAYLVRAALQRDTARTELTYLTTHDPLSGLPNRRLLLESIEQVRATSRRLQQPFALIALNLDGFKAVNDGVGHGNADEVLREVGERLSGLGSPADLAAHLGGDNFVFLQHRSDDASTRDLVRQLRAALARPFVTQLGEVSLTASYGVVEGDGASEGLALLRDAETAVRAAKEAGRNRVMSFTVRLRERARTRFDVLSLLRQALEQHTLKVQYQPTIELATGRVVGVEALVRLRTEDGGHVAPDQFIALAEESGLISDLGEQVLRTACQDLAAWSAIQPGFLLAVNVSPHQFGQDDLVATVLRILTETDTDPNQLWLEITESALLAGPTVKTVIRRLRSAGVRFAIDDFGTGYSSLAHLRHMPVDVLKIDRSFVSGVGGRIEDQVLVQVTMDLARAFGLAVNAEGVETEAQYAHLRDLQCEYGQGYLWSPPVDAEVITDLLATQAGGT